MKPIFRETRTGSGRPTGSWLTLVLLLLVVAPSVCLLWFMSKAVQNERLAVRERLAGAYRGNLSVAQEQLEAYWRKTGDDLEARAQRLPAPVLFAEVLRSGQADAGLCFDSSGEKLAYPAPFALPASEVSDGAWSAAERLELSDPAAAAERFEEIAAKSGTTNQQARALLAQARCLVKAGKQDAAIPILLDTLGAERYQRAKDAQGRLIAPSVALMGLELLGNSAPTRAAATLDRLKSRLLNYDDSDFPASQRRFLMHEVQKLFPAQSAFPTLAAEDLAARFLESGPVSAGEPGLRATALPGVWQFTSAHGRVIALHHTEALLARMQAAISAQPLSADISVTPLPPGAEFEKYFVSLPAGTNCPGWRLGLTLNDRRLFDTATNQQVASYVWIGVLMLLLVAVLASLALGLVRRQMALTRLRNDLVANVTHELKTPLSSMRLLVDTLLNTKTLHEQTTREYLQMIAGENLRLSRLIDNFLTFSRMERNKYAFGFKGVSPSAIVEGATAAVRERFNSPECRFEVQTAPDLPSVMADADALVTAVVNLLDNAWKYSGDEKQITLIAGTENGSVFFRVKDNGIGLSPRETKRIFKRFYQVDQRLSRSAGGCGLGLSIVDFIVKAHHGTVRVQSQPGRGSQFTITLPAAETLNASERRSPLHRGGEQIADVPTRDTTKGKS